MPFLIPLIGLICGILSSRFLSPLPWALCLLVTSAIVFVAIRTIRNKPVLSFKFNSYNQVWIFLLFSGIGAMDIYFNSPEKLNEKHFSEIKGISGEVKDIRTFSSGERFVVEIKKFTDGRYWEKAHNFKIFLYTDGFYAAKGDIIESPVSLNLISDNPNKMNRGYAEEMARKGILYQSSAKGSSIKTTGHRNSIGSWAFSLREKWEILLENSSLQRESTDFLISILLGDRSFIQETKKDNFSNVGVSHLFALSGMHVGIILAFAMLAFFPLQVLGFPILRFVLTIIAIWTYGVLTGLYPSTSRACIMCTLFLIGLIFQRKNNLAASLVASAFVIVLCDPAVLYDIGFQMSVTCVFCLIFFADPLNPIDRLHHPRLYSLMATVIACLLLAICTWPLTSFYFNRVPLLFLPANLLIIPFLPVLLSAGLLYSIFLYFGYDNGFLRGLIDLFCNYIEKIATTISSIGDSTLHPQIGYLTVIFWILGLIVIGLALFYHSRKSLYGGVATLVLSLIFIPFLNNEGKDGFIVQTDRQKIAIRIYENGKDRLEFFPSHSISKIEIGEFEIISIDCNSETTIFNQLDNNNKRRFIILSSGMTHNHENLKDLPGIEKIIIHNSIKKNQELQIIEKLKEKGFSEIHSLRLDGPLAIDL